jgi:uncharacterized membrane protein YagU involved in acid resistance
MLGTVILVILLFALVWVWLKQFVWMMALDDGSFPGKYDKLIWSAVFIILLPLAPFAFAMWKIAWKEYWRAEREENEQRSGEEPT